MKKYFVIVGFALSGLAFSSILPMKSGTDPVPIPPSIQRTGDTAAGFKYLTTGDYLKSGIPLSFFRMAVGKSSENYLNRSGENQQIPYDYTAVKASNGELVVAPNCLQCHAQVFDGKLIIGLGNSAMDFRQSEKLDPRRAATAERMFRKLDPKKYEAAEPFLRVVKAIGGKIKYAGPGSKYCGQAGGACWPVTAIRKLFDGAISLCWTFRMK